MPPKKSIAKKAPAKKAPAKKAAAKKAPAAPATLTLGDTGVTFGTVTREWRCKYALGKSGGAADSAALKACQALLVSFLPKLKALPKAKITRQMCGSCGDFKVNITQPLAEHGAWAAKSYNPLEKEFMAKLKKIPGTSRHDVQELTFVEM